MVLDGHADLDISAAGIGQGQMRDHLRVAELDYTRCGQSNRLPDSAVAVADGRDPIPAFRGHECWAIQAHHPAVFSGTTFHGLFIRNSRMRWRGNAYSQYVLVLQ